MARQAGLLALVVEGEPELGGDDDLVANGSQGLANEFLIDERAVDLGGVEERDTTLDRRAQQSDHLVAVTGVGAVALAHAHAAKPEGRDLETVSERALVHVVSSMSTGRQSCCAAGRSSTSLIASRRGRLMTKAMT